MAKTAEYMRDWRARRKAEGRPVPSGTSPDKLGMVRVWLPEEGRRVWLPAGSVYDPDDYAHPLADVRVGP